MSITINLEWSAHMKMIVKTKCDKNILITGIITVEISLQYMKERKPLMDKWSKFIFAEHEDYKF